MATGKHMSKGGPKLFEISPIFQVGYLDLGLCRSLRPGVFHLAQANKKRLSSLLTKVQKTDPAEQYKLLEELHRAMMLEKDKRIAELEKEVASLLKSGRSKVKVMVILILLVIALGILCFLSLGCTAICFEIDRKGSRHPVSTAIHKLVQAIRQLPGPTQRGTGD
jgi:hypothetical protein